MARNTTALKPEYCEQAQKLCKLGATDAELADFFDVSVRTVYRWKAQNEAFADALKTGKEVADERVERSLYARANGYEHEEVDIRVVDKEIVQTKIVKRYPPDTVACIFWLKNRRPEQWRDRVEHTGSNGGPIRTEDVSLIDVARRLAFVLEEATQQPAAAGVH